MFVMDRLRTVIVILSAASALLPSVTSALDRVELRDGSRLEGELVELGGTQLKLRLRGGEKVLLRRDVLSAQFDSTRVSRRAATSDGVVRDDGYRVFGNVEIFPGRQQVRVTLASGASVEIPRKRVVQIIRKGDTIETETSVYTQELDQEIQDALKRLLRSEASKTEIASASTFLKECGIFAIERVRKALLTQTGANQQAKPEVKARAAKSPQEAALQHIDRVYRLKETVPTEVEKYDFMVFEVLASEQFKPKEDLLLFIFYRFVEESVPIARLLAMDVEEDPRIRGYSIDFLRRMQKNHDLVDVYRRSSGQVQLATAIALGKNQIYVGIPALFDALELSETRVRALAVAHLREFTGKNFRFRPDGAPHARAESVTAWRDWWAKHEDDLKELSVKVMQEGRDETPERRKAQRLWQAASLAYTKGDVDYSGKLLRDALAADPLFLRAQICLAMVYLLGHDKPKDALRVLDEIHKRNRFGLGLIDNYWVYLYTGHCHSLLGDSAKAREAYGECVVYNEHGLEGLRALADTAYKNATSSRSLSSKQRESELRVAAKTYKRAVDLIESREDRLVTMTMADMPLESNPLFPLRKHNRSVVEVRRHYRLRLHSCLLGIARVRYLLGEKEEAIKLLEKRIAELITYRKHVELKALEIEIHNFLGMAHEDLGNRLSALQHYRVVLRVLDPENQQSRRSVERMRKATRTAAGN